MKTSDLIALLSTVVSTIAIIVSARIALIAVRIQAKQSELDREQAQKDEDRNLADVARDLANRVTQINSLPFGPESAAAEAEMMGLVITASKLSDEDRGNWYLYYSLATAYSWMGESDKARAILDKALDKADSDHSRLIILNGKGWFFYNLGSDVDTETGRNCYDQIEQILKHGYTVDQSKQLMAYYLTMRAWGEHLAGNDDESVRNYVKAWQSSKKVINRWRRQQASDSVASGFIQAFGQESKLPDGVPPDLIEYAKNLSQLQREEAINQQVVYTRPVPGFQSEDKK